MPELFHPQDCLIGRNCAIVAPLVGWVLYVKCYRLEWNFPNLIESWSAMHEIYIFPIQMQIFLSISRRKSFSFFSAVPVFFDPPFLCCKSWCEEIVVNKPCNFFRKSRKLLDAWQNSQNVRFCLHVDLLFLLALSYAHFLFNVFKKWKAEELLAIVREQEMANASKIIVNVMLSCVVYR